MVIWLTILCLPKFKKFLFSCKLITISFIHSSSHELSACYAAYFRSNTFFLQYFLQRNLRVGNESCSGFPNSNYQTWAVKSLSIYPKFISGFI